MALPNGHSHPYPTTPARQILTVALTRHLTGNPLPSFLAKTWSQTPAHVNAQFNNVGFDLEGEDDKQPQNLMELEKMLRERHWDGVLFGWCVRGHVEFTQLFERVVGLAVDGCVLGEGKGGTDGRGKERTKLMFCAGPEDLVNTVLRNFPVEE